MKHRPNYPFMVIINAVEYPPNKPLPIITRYRYGFYRRNIKHAGKPRRIDRQRGFTTFFWSVRLPSSRERTSCYYGNDNTI